MFLKNKKYLFDGGSGQTLMEMGLETTGDLWSAQALLNENNHSMVVDCLLYTSPSPRDVEESRMPSSA